MFSNVGWNDGIKTMTKGELARFTIKSEKAYGCRGKGDTIPPNSTLIFEIELISWSEFEDLTKGDEGRTTMSTFTRLIIFLKFVLRRWCFEEGHSSNTFTTFN
jgi:hypothetical protein